MVHGTALQNMKKGKREYYMHGLQPKGIGIKVQKRYSLKIKYDILSFFSTFLKSSDKAHFKVSGPIMTRLLSSHSFLTNCIHMFI